MKISSFLALMLILSTPAYAQEDPFGFDTQSLIMNTTFIATGDIIQEGNNGFVEYIKTRVFLFARESPQQKVLDLETNYPVGKKPDSIDFVIEEPKSTPIQFIVNSKTEVKNIFPKVSKKVPYPIEKIPSDLVVYTEPSEFIDSDDPYIIRTASEIAEGEDDAYIISYKLAVWTKNNIDYSLDTLTADVQQKASWVLDHRKGVCDELTALFVAMARSLGMPARFVSGTAYTNYNNLNDWGSHAWAEVWIPEYGWVPFDLTYGQFGYVDPTHVILRYSIDPSEPSIKYEWRGRDVELKGRELELKTTLLERRGTSSPTIKIYSDLLHEEVEIGSYNLIKTSVQNLQENYQAIEMTISRPKEIIPDKEAQQVILGPKETKDIFWIVKVKEDLDSGYSYTMPIEIRSVRNDKTSNTFLVQKDKEFFTRDQIKETIELLEKPEEKKGNAVLSTYCKTDKNQAFIDESVKINCELKNKGTFVLSNTKACLETQCKKLSLQLNQEEDISFSYVPKTAGKKKLKITFDNIYLKQEENLEFESLDEPKIEIIEFNSKEKATFVEKIPVNFKLKRTSYSSPKNINIKLSLGGIEKEWGLDSLDEEVFSHEFLAREMNGKSLKGQLSLIYELNGKKYSSTKEFSGELTNLSFFNNLKIFFNKILNVV